MCSKIKTFHKMGSNWSGYNATTLIMLFDCSSKNRYATNVATTECMEHCNNSERSGYPIANHQRELLLG